MVSLLLRTTYPNLRCLAFGVPGSVFSENLAEECSSWVTSYVLDADVVPRLAIHQFEDLRDSVLKMICRIKVPKYKVFALERSSTRTRQELTEESMRMLYNEDEIPDSDFKSQLDAFLDFQAELKQKIETTEHYIELFPPGKIIQLFRTKVPTTNPFSRLISVPNMNGTISPKQKSCYIARWIQRKDLRRIILSSHMINDHEPGNMRCKIQNVAQSIFDLSPPAYKLFEDADA